MIMITNELKQRILGEMARKRAQFSGSDAKFAVSLGINNAQYSRVKKGETEQVLSDAKWLSIARLLEIQMGDAPAWKTAETPVYQFIYGQLRYCQLNAASRLFCDIADIGKTYTAKQYVKSNRNAVYVDCSQVKSKQKLIRFIAKEFGVSHTGKYSDVYSDLVYYLRSLEKPLVILDEAGDLDYQAFLELKALWNATERTCGWYMMGADGLREKMRRSINCNKVGYAEMFSRYGNRYQKASPDSAKEVLNFKSLHAALIITANAPKANINIQALVRSSDYSLRRIQDELRKIG